MNFQTIIVIILIIVLIICLTMVGITLKKGGTSTDRIMPTCPDYWTMDASGLCVNTRDLGTCPAAPGQKHLTMDFTQSPYVGSDGTCQKYTWAQKCGQVWENITYGISKSPCDTTTTT
jgi:hypothetical protein